MTDMEDVACEPPEVRLARADGRAGATPRGDRAYEDFAVGEYVHFTRRFSYDDFAAFAALSGDRNPLHHDADYARRSGFAGPIVPLQLAAAPLSAIAGMLLPGRRSLVFGCQLRALQPVDYERPIEYSAKIVSKHDALRTLGLQVIAFRGASVLLESRLHVRVRDDVEAESCNGAMEAVHGNACEARVALVTGATGEIGRAVSCTLARRGWKLILQGRDGQRVAAVAHERRRDGAEAFALVGDLATAGERRKLIERLAELPAATALVHAASPAIDAALGELVEVNYAALRELAESLLGRMLARQQGRVLLIGSTAVDHAQPGWEDYVAAKQAAAGYVRAFDQRYSPYGLFGSIVAPGFVLGDFSQAWRPDDAECLLAEEVAEAIVDELETPERRPGRYLRLAPGSRRRGEFGFHEPRGEPQPTAGSLANGDSPSSALCGAGVSPAERQARRLHHNSECRPSEITVDEIVRRFFRLPNDANLAEAGLGLTPGWDSLGHLELLLHLEASLGVSFGAGELSRTMRFADLERLLDANGSTV
ncbi:MAG TPA: SDR family NAD(P)-dependent oxidoreductase [Pirellulales bacterium]|nr:SDR family NAD(P)-dependent oxidoreductase [Pirellulales bacterium]